ncbi:Pycsar system effector family protein [Pseudomonadota bacterium]
MKELRKVEAQLEQTSQALEQAVRKVEGDKMEALMMEADNKNDDLHAKKHAKKKRKEKLNKALGTNRGIETMFRSAYRVQMDLTGLADNKANMMISINGIIISIIIASVAPKLDANPWLLIPTTIFLVGNLISIIYAILAARPRVSSQPISLEDLRHSEGNILFFGNFANMSEAEFMEGMVEMVGDNSIIYESMIRNIYGLGSVLKKKFALLHVAYNTFMAALILGVSSFIGVFVWIGQTSP